MTAPPHRRPWWPPRLADVAGAAGVSVPTVSRALTSSTDRPSEGVEHIRRAAADCGYYRHAPPPRLLVLTSELRRLGYWQTISGVMDAARLTHTHVEIHALTGTDHDLEITLATALDSRVDGVVVVEFDSLSREMLKHLPHDLPVAIAGGFPQTTPSGHQLARAWIDDRAGAQLATEHLLELGHRAIAYVGLPPAGHPDPRALGWRDALTRAGLPAGAPLAMGWSVETGHRAASRVLERGATAVLCGNDGLAVGLLAGLADAGVAVPGAVSVIGMDDDPMASMTRPALSTVRQDFHRLGEVAAHLALGNHDEGIGEVEIPMRLVLRGTTSSP